MKKVILGSVAALAVTAAQAGSVTLWDKQWHHQTGQHFTHTLSSNLVNEGNVLSNGTLHLWAKSDFNQWHEEISTVSIDGTELGTNIDVGSPGVQSYQYWSLNHTFKKNTRLLKTQFSLDDGLLNNIFADGSASVGVDFSDSVHALFCNYFSKVKLTFDYVADTTTNPTGGGEPGIPAVPVPAAAWLFGTALIGFAGARRKLRKS